MITPNANKPTWFMQILVGTLLLMILAPDDVHARLRTRGRPLFGRAWVRLQSARYDVPYRSPPKHAEKSVPTADAALQARIARLITTINVSDGPPEPMNMVSTPSIDELVKIGRPAMGPLLDLLLNGSGDEVEHRLEANNSIDLPPDLEEALWLRSLRLCAMVALSEIAAREYGWVPGRGYADADKMWEWQRIRQEIGEPMWTDPDAQRRRVAKNWRAHFQIR
jgi:hypothetical protein